MLDEELDHIIRNAVDKHHPAYNDKAWGKMELKLDKHLPQNNDRRKFIFFLLFFLLLGGGAFFTISHFAGNEISASKEFAENTNDKQSTTQSLIQKTAPAHVNIESTQNKNTVDQDTDNAGNITSLSKDLTENEKENKPPALSSIRKAAPVNDNALDLQNKNKTGQVTGNPASNGSGKLLKKNSNPRENPEKNNRSAIVRKGRSNIRIATANPAEDLVQDKKPETKNDMPPAGKTVNTVEKRNIVITAAEPESNESENITAIPADLNKEKNAIAEQKKDTAKATEDKKEVAVPENKISLSPDKKKPIKNVAGNFGITFSAGPDLSFIQLNKPGKVTLNYGAGLSYNFKKRITLRAGFYASEKIYKATPDQYQLAPGINYYYLEKIDATCKIYEIPVSLSYNFWQRKNHNWFGSAGLSSFLMKTESYDYGYKTPAGQTYNYKHKISNENKHYFAVLTLSGGYQYHLNKRVSLQAEPYVKLPLAGVGLGKIKLNSAGILFTVTVKPFAKKR